MTNIAFIGVGNMGAPMARNLVKAGHGVTAFDLSPAVLEPVVKAGARRAASAAEAVREADAVITMLPAGQHVRNVYLEGGILAHAPQSAILIDSSTIDIDSARFTRRRRKRALIISMRPSRAVWVARKPVRSRSCAAEQTAHSSAPDRFSNTWASASCWRAAPGRGRQRRSATTCFWPFQ